MNYPQRWFWRRGRVTNEYDGDREFLYLHFMRWQSDLLMPKSAGARRSCVAAPLKKSSVSTGVFSVDRFCIVPDRFRQQLS